MNAWYTILSALPFGWLQFTFMKNALLALLIVSPLFALLGCMVVGNRMAYFSDAIGHAALTGIAIGALLGIGNPLWAMIGFAVLLALSVTLLRRYSVASVDTIIGLVMSFTVALGIVILSRGGGFAKYTRFLIGDILSITAAEINALLLLFTVVLLLWLLFFNQLFLVSLSHALARSRNLRVWLTEALFSAIVAVTVTVCIPWIGLLVINAMIILPAAAARNVAQSTPQYVWFSVAVGVASGVAGLAGSYYWATATGATIVLFSMVCFILTVGIRRVRGG